MTDKTLFEGESGFLQHSFDQWLQQITDNDAHDPAQAVRDQVGDIESAYIEHDLSGFDDQ